jgi:hypothetical protein
VQCPFRAYSPAASVSLRSPIFLVSSHFIQLHMVSYKSPRLAHLLLASSSFQLHRGRLLSSENVDKKNTLLRPTFFYTFLSLFEANSMKDV